MLRLSPLQAQVIAHAHIARENLPLSIARTLKVRQHRVRYALDTLIRSGILNRVPRIELSRLGYLSAHMFFSVRSLQRATTRQLLKGLTQAKGVVFLAELGGEYQYELVAAVRHPAELTELFPKELSAIVTNHAVSFSRTHEFYPKNYLSPTLPSASKISVNQNCPPSSIDSIDHKILGALAAFGGDSLRECARRLGIPFATLRTRVQKLNEKGVLAEFIYDCDPLSYGYNEFILLIYTKGLGASLEKELFSAARRHPNITNARSLVGEWNFEIGIEVQRAEEVVLIIEEFTERLSEEVIKTKLMQRFRGLVYRPYPF